MRRKIKKSEYLTLCICVYFSTNCLTNLVVVGWRLALLGVGVGGDEAFFGF